MCVDEKKKFGYYEDKAFGCGTLENKSMWHFFGLIFSSFLKKSELISAVWLVGWLSGALILKNWEDIETFGFFAIDSVDSGGSTIIKILDQALLWVPEL
jgi:hypothetical protein